MKEVAMKRLALIVTAVLVLALGIISCTPIEQPDIPTYTADQVIAVAQARYPSCYYRYDRTVDTPTSISVEYIGVSKKAWKVVISCPQGYRLDDWTTSKTLYFSEIDGSWHSSLMKLME